MKTYQLLWTGSLATIAVAGFVLSQLGAPSAVAEESTSTTTTVEHESADHPHQRICKASEVIGLNVRGLKGDDNIGSINDLVIDENDGRIKYAAVSFGGFLGMGDKLFAVPLQALEFVKTDDDSYARIDVTEETLRDKKGFDQDHWPNDADSGFGVRTQPQVGRTMSAPVR